VSRDRRLRRSLVDPGASPLLNCLFFPGLRGNSGLVGPVAALGAEWDGHGGLGGPGLPPDPRGAPQELRAAGRFSYLVSIETSNPFNSCYSVENRTAGIVHVQTRSLASQHEGPQGKTVWVYWVDHIRVRLIPNGQGLDIGSHLYWLGHVWHGKTPLACSPEGLVRPSSI
jgi:hypothetical protein